MAKGWEESMEGEREAAFVRKMKKHRIAGLLLVIFTLMIVIAMVVGFC